MNGYGTIGKRVADAIVQQPDMKLIGVSKTKPNHEAKTAVDKKYPLYVVKGAEESFSGVGFEVEGTIEEMIEKLSDYMSEEEIISGILSDQELKQYFSKWVK